MNSRMTKAELLEKLEAAEKRIAELENAESYRHLVENMEKGRDFIRQVMDTMGAGLTIIDNESRFEYVNPAYARMIGVDPEDLIGQHPHDVTAPEDQDKLKHAWEARKQGQTSTYETRLIHADGRLIPVMITSTPRIADGKMTGSLAVIKDLTDRERAKKAEQKNEAILDMFFSQSLDGFFFMMMDEPIQWNESVDKEKTLDYVFGHQHVTRINNAMLEQYHATREEFMGKTPNDIFAHDIQQEGERGGSSSMKGTCTSTHSSKGLTARPCGSKGITSACMTNRDTSRVILGYNAMSLNANKWRPPCGRLKNAGNSRWKAPMTAYGT